MNMKEGAGFTGIAAMVAAAIIYFFPQSESTVNQVLEQVQQLGGTREVSQPLPEPETISSQVESRGIKPEKPEKIDGLVFEIDSVYDGDTIKVFMPKLPDPLHKVKIRLYGIDTPEYGHRAQCAEESELAVQAKQLLLDLIGDDKTIVVTDYKWGKFGGRIIGNVWVGDVNASELLIEKGLARAYFGDKKVGWCE